MLNFNMIHERYPYVSLMTLVPGVLKTPNNLN